MTGYPEHIQAIAGREYPAYVAWRDLKLSTNSNWDDAYCSRVWDDWKEKGPAMLTSMKPYVEGYLDWRPHIPGTPPQNIWTGAAGV